MSRPAQYKQSSRKGKKSWRKNIDLREIESKLEENAENEIVHGETSLHKVQDDALFQVDSTGDEVLKQKLIKRKQIQKNLKSREILDSIKTDSKIGSLKHMKHGNQKGKVQGVSKREIARLMALAGRVHGESKNKNRIAKDGLVKSDAKDIWGQGEEDGDSAEKKKILSSGIAVDSNLQIPEEILQNSTTGWSKPSVKPTTLGHEPITVKEYEETPHPGKSYNPSTADWSNLITKEYHTAKIKEDNKVAILEYEAKIQKLIKVLKDGEEEESSEDEDEKEEEEEEGDDDTQFKLSVNDITINKKKSKYQRNKMRKHQEKLRIMKELKALRQRVAELEKVEDMAKEIEQQQQTQQQNRVKKTKHHKKHKLGTKHSVIDENLEVKLSDELSGSLRKLRPEGSLLYDTVRKLQSKGKIEARIPLRKKRKYTPKVTEKWSYKDFK